MRQRTARLVESLVRDLEPVRPITPLRQAGAAVALAGGVAVAIGLAVLEVDAHVLRTAARYPSFGVMFVGLAVVAAGGALAALAAAVPGREGVARTGAILAGAGVLVAAGVGGALAFGGPEATLPRSPLADAIGCLAVATLFAVPPAAAALAFAVRSAPLRPLGIGVAAVAGGVGIGALVPHLTCGHLDAAHLLVAHALAPGLAALAAAVPLFLALRLAERVRSPAA